MGFWSWDSSSECVGVTISCFFFLSLFLFFCKLLHLENIFKALNFFFFRKFLYVNQNSTLLSGSRKDHFESALCLACQVYDAKCFFLRGD